MTGRVLARQWAVGLAMTIAIACTSCSSRDTLHPVHGRVRVKGEPAAGATVVFHREGPAGQDLPTGIVDSEGSFTLTTGGKPGAPAGNYTVTVVWPETKKLTGKEPITMGAELVDGPDRLRGVYGSPQKSALKAEIKSGKNELDPFELK